MKQRINLRFDSELWKDVKRAAEKTRRSATEYLEYAAEQQLMIDLTDSKGKKTQEIEGTSQC